MGLIDLHPRKAGAPTGGFFVQEIERRMHIELLANGDYFGDIIIGKYVGLHVGSSTENLKGCALRRIKTKLQCVIAEIEEGN
jgi:hydrogenase maturation factor